MGTLLCTVLEALSTCHQAMPAAITSPTAEAAAMRMSRAFMTDWNGAAQGSGQEDNLPRRGTPRYQRRRVAQRRASAAGTVASAIRKSVVPVKVPVVA
ncbi:hypothetical protein GCM10022293_02060 [Azospirillum formosense]